MDAVNLNLQVHYSSALIWGVHKVLKTSSKLVKMFCPLKVQFAGVQTMNRARLFENPD